MAFLTGLSRSVLKSRYTGGAPEEGFWRCFTDGLKQSLVSSAAQARLEQDQILKKCLKLNTLFNGFKVYTDW